MICPTMKTSKKRVRIPSLQKHPRGEDTGEIAVNVRNSKVTRCYPESY